MEWLPLLWRCWIIDSYWVLFKLSYWTIIGNIEGGQTQIIPTSCLWLLARLRINILSAPHRGLLISHIYPKSPLSKECPYRVLQKKLAHSEYILSLEMLQLRVLSTAHEHTNVPCLHVLQHVHCFYNYSGLSEFMSTAAFLSEQQLEWECDYLYLWVDHGLHFLCSTLCWLGFNHTVGNIFVMSLLKCQVSFHLLCCNTYWKLAPLYTIRKIKIWNLLQYSLFLSNSELGMSSVCILSLTLFGYLRLVIISYSCDCNSLFCFIMQCIFFYPIRCMADKYVKNSHSHFINYFKTLIK